MGSKGLNREFVPVTESSSVDREDCYCVLDHLIRGPGFDGASGVSAVGRSLERLL